MVSSSPSNAHNSQTTGSSYSSNPSTGANVNVPNSSTLNGYKSHINNNDMDDDKQQQQQAQGQLVAAQQAGLLRFNIPEHTPIIIGEVAGRTLHRIEVREIARDHEQQQHLQTVMPAWIVDVLQGVCG